MIIILSISIDIGASSVVAVNRDNADGSRNILIPNDRNLSSTALRHQEMLQQQKEEMETAKIETGLLRNIDEQETVDRYKLTERIPLCKRCHWTNSSIKLKPTSSYCPHSQQLFSDQQQFIPYEQQLLKRHQLIVDMANRSHEQPANHPAADRNHIHQPTNPLLDCLHPLLLHDAMASSGMHPASVALGYFDAASSLHSLFGVQPISALSQPFGDIPLAPLAPAPVHQHQYLLPLSFYRVHGAWVGAAMTSTSTLTKSGQMESADSAGLSLATYFNLTESKDPIRFVTLKK